MYRFSYLQLNNPNSMHFNRLLFEVELCLRTLVSIIKIADNILPQQYQLDYLNRQDNFDSAKMAGKIINLAGKVLILIAYVLIVVWR